MADLVEFWPILESKLVEHAMHEYLIFGSENHTKNTMDCTLSNSIGLTEFGSSMKKL
jgi:hypothetical protein